MRAPQSPAAETNGVSHEATACTLDKVDNADSQETQLNDLQPLTPETFAIPLVLVVGLSFLVLFEIGYKFAYVVVSCASLRSTTQHCSV